MCNSTPESQVLSMDENDIQEQMLLTSLDDKPTENSFSSNLSESAGTLLDEDELDDKEALRAEIAVIDYKKNVKVEETRTKLSDKMLLELEREDSPNTGIFLKNFDVLCGQSRICANHTGNRRFQVVLDIYAPKYDQATSKQEKMTLTKEIVAVILTSGGRFLKYKDGIWQEISTVTARDKVSHALRTKVASWKRQQQEQKDEKEGLSPQRSNRATHRRRRSTHNRRRSSASSVATSSSDIVTTSFDGSDPTSTSLVENLLKAQREIFANLQQSSEHGDEHPLIRNR